VGKPGTFGASVGVVNAFDGLRHLMELVEGNEAKFDEMKYGDLFALVGRVDQAVVNLSALDAWSTETTALRAMIGQTQENLIKLRDKAVAPLVGMYHYYTDRGSPIPGNKIQVAIQPRQHEVMTLKSGAGNQHTMTGFGAQPSVDLRGLEARMLAAERKSESLERELASLRNAPRQTSGFAVPGFDVPDVFGERASGPGVVPPTLVTDVKDLGLRITKLEGLKDGDAITVGIRTFRSSKDCKTFLLQECPGGILNTYNYDMVALLHRIKREGAKLTSTEQVQNDSAV
jgi:hypothetical protein